MFILGIKGSAERNMYKKKGPSTKENTTSIPVNAAHKQRHETDASWETILLLLGTGARGLPSKLDAGFGKKIALKILIEYKCTLLKNANKKERENLSA